MVPSWVIDNALLDRFNSMYMSNKLNFGESVAIFMTGNIFVRAGWIVFVVTALLVTPSRSFAATPPSPILGTSEVTTFPETMHTLRGEFRMFWTSNGGLEVFGYPVTEEYQEQTAEGSFTVQYFERNRFELHPGQRAPFNVQLGRLGDPLLRRTGHEIPSPSQTGETGDCLWFPVTRHSVCGPIKMYWQQHGLGSGPTSSFDRSLMLFGLPLTDQRIETNSSGHTVMTQWFERARLEDHGSQGGILLGLLGREVLAPSSPCPIVPQSRDSKLRQGTCIKRGSELTIDIDHFAPDEQISMWLTAPDNRVFGGQFAIPARHNGTLRGLVYPTQKLWPGLWYLVFQGQESGHQSVLYFYVHD
ncbi:MAG: hypothetical protein NVS4B8_00420 [Herpetosiphon sp.]